jgi:hypothetical protein
MTQQSACGSLRAADDEVTAASESRTASSSARMQVRALLRLTAFRARR